MIYEKLFRNRSVVPSKHPWKSVRPWAARRNLFCPAFLPQQLLTANLVPAAGGSAVGCHTPPGRCHGEVPVTLRKRTGETSTSTGQRLAPDNTRLTPTTQQLMLTAVLCHNYYSLSPFRLHLARSPQNRGSVTEAA